MLFCLHFTTANAISSIVILSFEPIKYPDKCIFLMHHISTFVRVFFVQRRCETLIFRTNLIGVNWTLLPHDMHNRTHFSIMIFHSVGYGGFVHRPFVHSFNAYTNKLWTIIPFITCVTLLALCDFLIRFDHIFTVELSLPRRYTWKMPAQCGWHTGNPFNEHLCIRILSWHKETLFYSSVNIFCASLW